MRILVTGAAGLIGSSVAERLTRDHEVVGLDLRPGPHVHVIADCDDVSDWGSGVGAVDAVVHTAALHAPHVGRHSDAEFRRVNVDTTKRLLEYALAVGANHFLLTSTTSLYGHALETEGQAAWIDEGVEPEPRDIYDVTKLEAERAVESAGASLVVTSLRMSRCFPEPAEAMAWYRLHRGVDRRDVAQAHALALDRTGPPARFVVSAATPFEQEDAGELLTDASAVISRRCPGVIERMAAKGWFAPHSIGRVYDCRLAIDQLGYSPRYGIDACLAGDWDPAPSS
jgi:nucleoside-diphosphate-sugar epimerase